MIGLFQPGTIIISFDAIKSLLSQVSHQPFQTSSFSRHIGRVSQHNDPATTMNQVDGFIGRKIPFRNITGDQITFESLLISINNPCFAQGLGNMRTTNAPPGKETDPLRIKGLTLFNAQFFIDPLDNLQIPLQAERLKFGQRPGQIRVLQVEAVTQQMHVGKFEPLGRQLYRG